VGIRGYESDAVGRGGESVEADYGEKELRGNGYVCGE
jgi:hypothetical protein